MKRELKGDYSILFLQKRFFCHKAYPDEKGTERVRPLRWFGRPSYVTRHIPMKRELKALSLPLFFHMRERHKAYPDEKGTERSNTSPG